MLGYKYNTESEAQNAVTQCNLHYGYPKIDSITNSWCGYIFSELDGFYYIPHDNSLNIVLGEPIEFIITE